MYAIPFGGWDCGMLVISGGPTQDGILVRRAGFFVGANFGSRDSCMNVL